MASNNKWVTRFFDPSGMQSLLGDLSHTIALERLGPAITRRVIWFAPGLQPRIALTFDDGPHPLYTPKLLDILRKESIPATFFLVGKHIKSSWSIAERVVAEGHEVANHTFTHPMMIQLAGDEIRAEIGETDRLLKELCSCYPKFLRPPMGVFSKRVLDIIESCGYLTVIGDVYPRDPHLPGREKIYHRVLSRVVNGSIIILHDGGNSGDVDRSQTVWAVERLIPALRERGFEFVTLSNLIG